MPEEVIHNLTSAPVDGIEPDPQPAFKSDEVRDYPDDKIAGREVGMREYAGTASNLPRKPTPGVYYIVPESAAIFAAQCGRSTRDLLIVGPNGKLMRFRFIPALPTVDLKCGQQHRRSWSGRVIPPIHRKCMELLDSGHDCCGDCDDVIGAARAVDTDKSPYERPGRYWLRYARRWLDEHPA